MPIIDGRQYDYAPPVVAWTCEGCDIYLDQGVPCDIGQAHCYEGRGILRRTQPTTEKRG